MLVLLPSSNSKLLAKWQGSFVVIRRVGDVDYEIVHLDSVVILVEEDCRNKIAFNSLYLFSFKSIIYKQMARYCIIHARRKTRPLRSCI